MAVRIELGAAVPLILDGGPCAVGVESTVLDLSGSSPVLLRAGGIPVEELEELLGPIQHARPVDERPSAPGQLRHHYAPRKPFRLVREAGEIPDRPDVGRLTFGIETSPHSAGVVINLSPAGDLREAAANFFRALRRLDDDTRVSAIYAVPLPAHGLGLAMNERLERAAGLMLSQAEAVCENG